MDKIKENLPSMPSVPVPSINIPTNDTPLLPVISTITSSIGGFADSITGGVASGQEGLVSRIRPLARQAAPLFGRVTSTLPIMRDQYPEFTAIAAGGIVALPSAALVGKVRGIGQGLIIGVGVYGALATWKEIDRWEK